MTEESSLHEIAKRQFKERRGDLASLTVPEWNDVEIFYFSAANVDEFVKISQHLTGDGIGIEAYLTAFILFCRDAGQKRLFGEHNRGEILEFYDPQIVMRVVKEMGVFTSMFGGGEDEAKND